MNTRHKMDDHVFDSVECLSLKVLSIMSLACHY